MPSELSPRETPRDFRHPLQSLQNEIDQFFSNFARPHWSDLFSRAGNGNALASVDMVEKDDAIEVRVDVPGMTEKDIDVTLADGVLSIKGERRQNREEKKADYHLIERSFGVFQRRLNLPCDIDDSKVKATVKQGVLEIELPKSAKAKSSEHKIAIKAG